MSHDLYDHIYKHDVVSFPGLAGVGVGPTTASPGGGVATAQPASTTATPSGSGQGTGKETFEPFELNYLELLGQEVLAM